MGQKIPRTSVTVADFFAETEKLAKKIGSGHLEGIFAVDGGERSVPLEVGYWKNHMGRNGHVDIRDWTTEGTGPHAAQNSLEQNYQISLADIAKSTLAEGPQRSMERHVERVNDTFSRIAPKDTGQYRQSTARFVVDDGAPTYERYGPFYGKEPSG